MRKILTISISKEIYQNIKKDIKENNYATTSEFFRDLYRQWKENTYDFKEVKDKKVLENLKNEKEKAEKISKKDLLNL